MITPSIAFTYQDLWKRSLLNHIIYFQSFVYIYIYISELNKIICAMNTSTTSLGTKLKQLLYWKVKSNAQCHNNEAHDLVHYICTKKKKFVISMAKTFSLSLSLLKVFFSLKRKNIQKYLVLNHIQLLKHD